MPRRSGPARWPLVLLALAFAALGVLTVVQRGDDDEDADAIDPAPATVTTIAVPAEAVPGDSDPIEVSRRSYTITYRVEGFATDGGAGIGEIVRGLRQQEIRVAFERGRFLRVWGTIPVDDLVALTRTLEATTDPNGQVTAKS